MAQRNLSYQSDIDVTPCRSDAAMFPSVTGETITPPMVPKCAERVKVANEASSRGRNHHRSRW